MLPVLVFKSFRIREPPILVPSRKKLESKNDMSQLFQKPQRTCGFHERTSKKLVDLWLVFFSTFLKIVVIYQNLVFNFLEL